MKKKYCVFLVAILLIMSILTVSVNAAYSFKTTMNPSSSSVEAGTEVVMTVTISDLDVGDNGISSFSANLYYDSDVFETLTDSDVEGLNDFSSTYSTSSGEIALLKNGFVNSDTEIMQITLKVKSGIEDGTEGTVTLSNITASNSDEEISGTTVSQSITVGAETSSSGETGVININPSTTDDESESTETTDIVEIDTSDTESVYDTDTNSSDEDMPYTGTDSTAFIQIILGVILIALAIYIKIRKLNEDVR